MRTVPGTAILAGLCVRTVRSSTILCVMHCADIGVLLICASSCATGKLHGANLRHGGRPHGRGGGADQGGGGPQPAGQGMCFVRVVFNRHSAARENDLHSCHCRSSRLHSVPAGLNA
jgi:hypothetical protein